MWEGAERWEKEQYLPSILPSLAASQYARACLTWPEPPLGSGVHLKEGMWAVAVWPSDWGCEARPLGSSIQPLLPDTEPLCAPRSRRRLRQQIAVKSQGPSPAPQPRRISMRRTAAPSVMWDVPTRTGHLLCFARSGYSLVFQGREELRAEAGAEARDGALLTVTMVIPCGFIPFCLSVCFATKAG